MLQVIDKARSIHRMGTTSTFLVHAVPKGNTSARVTENVIKIQLPMLKMIINSGDISVDAIDVSANVAF